MPAFALIVALPFLCSGVYMLTMANDKFENLDDEKLMVAYQEGDMAAFEQLYNRYQHKIYNFLLIRLVDEKLCQDLFQEIFLKVHRSRNSFDPSKSFATWLFTIAHNLIKNEFKRMARARTNLVQLPDEVPMDCQNGDYNPDIHLELRESAAMIRKALEKLPPTQRKIILLNKIFGFSYAEIAQITGSSQSAVKQKAYRGFLQLKEILGAMPKSVIF